MFIKPFITFVIALFTISILQLNAEEVYKWEKLSGDWSVHTVGITSYMSESRIKHRVKNNDEITNYNSVKTFSPVENYSSFNFSLQKEDYPGTRGEIMIFFALKNHRDFYAFRFTSENNNKKKIDFINSKIIDPSKPRQVKQNYMINKILSEDYDLKSGKKYDIEIKTCENKIQLLIDGNKIIKAEAAENLSSGHIGFGSRNTMLQIYNFKVFRGNDIIFNDDFTKDSIKRLVVKAELKHYEKN